MSTIVNGEFINPNQRKTMSVEDAVEYWVLATKFRYLYSYNSVYDFVQTLVKKCNVDKDFVLQNMEKIIYALQNLSAKEGIKLVSQEIKKHLVPSNEGVDYDAFRNQYDRKVEAMKKRIAMKQAQKAYNERSWFGKMSTKRKYGLPSKANLTNKTSQEINEMYNIGKSR